MTIETITNILKRHYIPYQIKNGRVLADSMIAFTPLFSETVDLTNYTKNQLYAWLGY